MTVDIAPPDVAVPPANCYRCPRLAAYRADNRAAEPHWHNAPVPSFGPEDARLLIVGLAPGLRGANCTGRPFTGDFAGDLLYRTLGKFGFASGRYGKRRDDGVRLQDCRITNAVRCVPPKNKPETSEFDACRPFLQAEFAALLRLKVLLALGKGAHDQILKTLGVRPLNRYPFAHGALHDLPDGRVLADSYHCSRYNTNTGVLTVEMFEAVFAEVRRVVAA